MEVSIMIQAYKKYWKGYVDFSGITNRKDYWLAVLASAIITIILAGIGLLITRGKTNTDSNMSVLSILLLVYSLATLLPSLAIMVRRLRDAGQSWANLFWSLLPVAGTVILIVKLCKPSSEIDGSKNGSAKFSSGTPVSHTYKQPTTPISSQKPQPAAQQSGANTIQKYVILANKYAHIESLFAENPEKKELEAQFLTGGINAQEGIAQFLTVCATGQMTQGWWNGAASLTAMIRKINKDTAESILLRLKNLNTNIWEYHTQVIDTADKELLALKKENGGYPDGRIPAEFAHAELLNLQNLNPPEKRLEAFFAMQDSVPSWSGTDQAFYYFIAGGAARVLFPVNKSNLAFYAAQVSCDPNPNSMGWQHLRETEGATLPATLESAKRMCEKYPLPKSMEETKDYIYGFEKKEEELSRTNTAVYTLDTGLNDLIALFRTYPQLDRSEIQAVGQKIYDANIPLVSGVGGMHQLYARFKERMPMYGAELSRIWDGIGDWAD